MGDRYGKFMSTLDEICKENNEEIIKEREKLEQLNKNDVGIP